ncbi:TPA: ferrochelatase [Neisseria meningitidis]|uniref:ferrochelatase n=1 Tax=Neisseria meningitidis TaxID=487 RepID=UPI000C33C60D|nr:ferrochelatase [Neisseria meningitidis]MBG8583465.1 ferrochelatase [Neisseria meningitidis]MBG9078397.1 ferrochelatase [Neisseria meningitidis]MBG9080365.1 ferrochelatase [Neisseria meningitidis]MBG9086491.1 ferrochelatase [Neisseria meningitidis]MBG9090393.1 ferrochelatase [Neisseria meningitidis]
MPSEAASDGILPLYPTRTIFQKPIMLPFFPEPSLSYTQQNRTAVLLLNLGTPDAPTAQAVRPYLKSFLTDRRVVELPKWLWYPILHGLVLTLRSKKSAHAYEKIWFKEGSPLEVYTARQAAALAERMPDLIVRHAMTYGNPSVADVLSELKAQGAGRLLVIPMYPQYAASSSGAAVDKVCEQLLLQRNQMSVRTVSRFYDDTGYIDAMKNHILRYWAEHGRGKKLMLSFHGVPQKHHDLGDPYPDECRHTAKLLAEALELTEDQYVVSFQSQFGRAKWVTPSTQDLFGKLPKQGVTELDVFCPGFLADCLETMEEIALMGREQFYEAGGKSYRYIPCLNDNPDWIDALVALAEENLGGWR